MDKRYASSQVATATPIGLTVITFEILFDSLEDIKIFHREKNWYSFTDEVNYSIKIIDELFDALDFEAEMAKDLGALYVYCKRLLNSLQITKEISKADDVKIILNPIVTAFKQIDKKPDANVDKLKNSIVAGMTYGRGTLSEVVVNNTGGFQA